MNDELSKWNKPDTFELDSQRYLLDNIIEDLKQRAVLEAHKRYSPDKILWINPTEVEQEVVRKDISGEKEIKLTVRFNGQYQIKDNMSYWFWIYESIYINKLLDTEVINNVFKKKSYKPFTSFKSRPYR
jgi:hypothetical protein